MPADTSFQAADWAEIQLVVFDVDGTLYNQFPVRVAMAHQLLLRALQTGSLRHMKALAQFRRLREEISEREIDGFEDVIYQQIAAEGGFDLSALKILVEEWMELRPLNYVRRARVTGVERVFDRLRASGKKLGVWSDYPVPHKLAALNLHVDFQAAANDAEIGRLKPCPTGLCSIIRRAGVTPKATLMIGDRVDRDGEAARRAGTRALIRSRRPIEGFSTFRTYHDPIFDTIP